MLTTPDPSSNPASACGLTDLQPLAPGPPGLSVWSPMLSHPQLLAHLSLLTCLPLTQASKSFCVSQWTLVASCHKALSCHQSLLRLSHLCLEKPPRSPPGCSSQPLPLPPLTPSLTSYPLHPPLLCPSFHVSVSASTLPAAAWPLRRLQKGQGAHLSLQLFFSPKFIYLFIFVCDGSSLLCVGFL